MKHGQTNKDLLESVGNKMEALILSDSFSATATKFLLMLVAMGGIAFVGATLPGLVKGIGAFRRNSRKHKKARKRYSEKQISNSFAYLKKKRLVEIVKESNGRVTVRLTNRGRKRLTEYSLDMLKIKTPERWDGKWRVLMFDIPARPKIYNSARNALRNKVKKLGFYQIQKSVWIYPYECEDELLFIAEMFKVQRYVEILTAGRILHENILRKHFSLA